MDYRPTERRLGKPKKVGNHTHGAYYTYLDVLQIWLKVQISGAELAWVKAQCRRLPSRRDRRAQFGPYNQSFRFRQPSELLLQYLDAHDIGEVWISYVEPARDMIRPDFEKLAREFGASVIQAHHSKCRTIIYGYADPKKTILCDGTNGSTGVRGSGTTFTWYTTLPSKVTGEIECFHLEARLSGNRAIKRAGIYCPADLLTFDHDRFWRSVMTNNLKLVEIDTARLGRWADNRATGKRRQKPVAEDVRRGQILKRAYSCDLAGRHLVQNIVDVLGRGPFLIQHDYQKLLRDAITRPSQTVYPSKNHLNSMDRS